MSNTHKMWAPYTESLNLNSIYAAQEFKSQKTSRKQVPRTIHILEIENLINMNTIVLDIGCGKFKDLISNHVSKMGGLYYGIDPHNETIRNNIDAINSCGGGQTDVVTISNVLNVIKEESIQLQIINQAYDALKIGGTLVVVVYEGVKNKLEREEDQRTGVKAPLTPIVTRDGFQHRKETTKYLTLVQKMFPNAAVKTFLKNGGKAIVATKNAMFTDHEEQVNRNKPN